MTKKNNQTTIEQIHRQGDDPAIRHTGTQPLQTSRLFLRRFTPDDAPAMFANWANDPQVARWMRWSAHANIIITQGVLQEWVAGYNNLQFYNWAIQRKEDDALIGSIGILPMQEEGFPAGSWEPGYCLSHSAWGQGYATEALQVVVEYFMADTGVQTLYCCHATENPASGSVMKKIGFTYLQEGTILRFDGTSMPAKYYQLKIENKSVNNTQ